MRVTTFPRRMATVVVLLAIAATASPAAAQGGPGGPPAVGTTIVRQQALTQTDEFVGRVQAINRVALVARVTGFLTKQFFTEGVEVKQGDLLYQIEKPPFEADLQAKQAALAQANAQLTNATITLGRAQTLLNTPAGQRSNVDDAVASQRTDAAMVMAAQANLQTSQINLGYTDITAPIAGRIARTLVTYGNVVGPGSGTLTTIVSQDPIYVYFPISLRSLLTLRDRYQNEGGLAQVVVRLRLADGTMYEPVGHIDYVDPTVSNNTDTVNVRGLIPNPDETKSKLNGQSVRALVDGEFVTVLLQGAAPVSQLAIPQAAVLANQEGNYVYVVAAGNKAVPTPVTLGQVSGAMVAITAGLKVDDVIVSDGVQRVRPNQPVNPAPAAPGPGGADGPPGGAPQQASAQKQG